MATTTRRSLPPLERIIRPTGTAGAARLHELARMLERVGMSCELETPGGEVISAGSGTPAFRAIFKDEEALRTPFTEFSLGRAYVDGHIDVEGDFLAMLDMRDAVGFGAALGQKLRFAYDLFLQAPTKVNDRAIHEHYTLGDDFYLTFIDKRYRFYSHCLFHSEDEALEDAAEHKLESMWNALRLEPGMRLLDIGGGWGGVTEYCGARGVHVTSLTLVEDSANYIRRLIQEKDLPGEVVVGDVLNFRAREPFDHAVMYGVIEHVPNYRRYTQRVWDALKPGGRVYMDASAVKEKFAISPFTRHYTWPGQHSFLAVQDLAEELIFNGFELVEVKRETRDYELTIAEWARRLDAAHDYIASGWGEEVWRAFRVFLWGGKHAFQTNRLQAYHVVGERRHDPGPRPGAVRRFGHYVASLR
ncbi:MAG TPA: class I SAM-dependent methyltransferase [Solirubrobacteraceae bacterium]|jgi:cyclopropane-fatty-acyl-phospholipid synthase|nr:class I SAM-dependent methyltransferase [Solirubrobacteraceae bacterium]